MGGETKTEIVFLNQFVWNTLGIMIGENKTRHIPGLFNEEFWATFVISEAWRLFFSLASGGGTLLLWWAVWIPRLFSESKNLTVFQLGFHIHSFSASLARYVAVGMLWILAVCGFLGYGMLCSWDLLLRFKHVPMSPRFVQQFWSILRFLAHQFNVSYNFLMCPKQVQGFHREVPPKSAECQECVKLEECVKSVLLSESRSKTVWWSVAN